MAPLENDDGVATGVGGPLVPFNDTVKGDPLAPVNAMLIVAVSKVPVNAVGENTAVIVQVLLAATELPHVFVWLKSAEYVLEGIVIVGMIVPEVVLLKVVDIPALEGPCVTVENASVTGLTKGVAESWYAPVSGGFGRAIVVLTGQLDITTPPEVVANVQA